MRRLLPVVDALAAVHAAGWVHGDLKTDNVLLDADGLAHLVDLGSARRIGSRRRRRGAPCSVSPERLDGAAAVVADDVYAFGVLLYELVSGHPPFYPDLTPQRVLEETPPALTSRPAPPTALSLLVADLLAKQPDARPQGMREVQARLETALEESAQAEAVPPLAPAAPAPLQPPPDAGPIRAQWRRTGSEGPSVEQVRREAFRRGLLASAVILALAAVGFTFFVLPGMVADRQPHAAAETAGDRCPGIPRPHRCRAGSKPRATCRAKATGGGSACAPAAPAAATRAVRRGTLGHGEPGRCQGATGAG